MIPTTIKNNRTLRALLLLGVTLISTLLLLIGSMSLHISGFSLTSFAYAAETGTTTNQVRLLQAMCTSHPSGPHCNNQDPVAQGCSKDAQTLALKEITNAQGELLATTQRRYSPICRSEWGRIIQAPNNHQPISITIAKNGEWASPGPVAFTTMVFVPNLSIASQIIGTASINGIAPNQDGGQGLAAFLPALPAVVQTTQK